MRAGLSQVAFGLFLRSTILRCFGTEEDAVLSAVDAHGEQVADAVRARPAGEDDWTALRGAIDTAIRHCRQDPGGLARTRLIRETPALRARQLEQQFRWRPLLAGRVPPRA